VYRVSGLENLANDRKSLLRIPRSSPTPHGRLLMGIR
jgi:hypothetical protein